MLKQVQHDVLQDLQITKTTSFSPLKKVYKSLKSL